MKSGSTTGSLETTLQAARESHRAGDLARAEALYRRVLQRDPSQPDSLYALARIAVEGGRDREAIPLLERVLARHPSVVPCLADLAVALQNVGRNADAIAAAKRALAVDPGNLSALNTLGNALRAEGQPEAAVTCFREALARHAGIAAIHSNLAAALRDCGRSDAALEEYACALALAPGDADVHLQRGTLLRALGRVPEAERDLRAAVAARPDAAEAHHALANLEAATGRHDDAEAGYRRAIELRPDYPEAFYNLGDARRAAGQLEAACEAYAGAVALAGEFVDARVRLAQTCADLGRSEEAIEHFTRALAQRPDDAESASGLGNALRSLGRFDAAAAAYERAVRARPGYAEGWCNLSTVHLDTGHLEHAVDDARRAIAAHPDLPDAYWNIAQASLVRGDFAQGWRKYEYRLLRRGANELAFPYPVWDGGPLAGRTLFVTAEQGVGDEIMFASCIPDAQRVAGACVVECDARLVPLFARSFPGATMVARLSAADGYPPGAPPPDARIAIGSLPLHFRGDPGAFPGRAGYLVPDPARVAAWRARYAALGAGLSVGIAWRGGKESLVRRARSVALADWAPLATAGAVHFVNLQYGDTAPEIEAARREHGFVVHDWDDADPLRDLDGFAAQIAALDLVISIDNATVHFAGAVGTPTWVLLPTVADWRWLEMRDDSPWYRSVRLFRQEDPGVWAPVLDRVRVALLERATRAAPPAAAGAARVADVAARATPARPAWVGLINDTTYWYHWGCTGTSTAIVRTLEARGYRLNRIPITGLDALAEVPRSLEDFDDRACFRRFADANRWLLRELDHVDHVVINGEGSLHGLNDYVANLLYVAYAAKVHLGRDVQIVNHSCYPDGLSEASESGAWPLYRHVYGTVDHVALREPVSHGLLTRAGIAATRSFDCLPLSIPAPVPGADSDRERSVVLAGSVAVREGDVAALASFATRMAAAGVPVRLLIGANMFPAAEDGAFARRMRERAGAALEVIDAGSFGWWLDTLAGAGVVVSGRFHHTIAAATLGTPYVLLESNTPKNAGLAAVLGSPPPLSLDAPDLADRLVARVGDVLEGRGNGAGAPRPGLAEQLRQQALENFARLPSRH